MNHFHRFIGLFMIVNFFLMPVSARAGDIDLSALKDAVDVLITAASSQSVDPGMASALSAVPGTTRAMITENSNAKMVAINEAMMAYPNREQELKILLDRYHAILAANTGDSSHWDKVIKEEKEKQRKEKEQEKKKFAEKKKKPRTEIQQARTDEEKHMYERIAGYQKKNRSDEQ